MYEKVEINMYDEVEYLFNQDCFIEMKDGEDTVITYQDTCIAPEEQHISFLTHCTSKNGKSDFAHNVDVQILRNSITGKESVAWTQQGTALSRKWRENYKK